MVSVSLIFIRDQSTRVSLLTNKGFGLWYVAEAAMILSYAEENRRGK